ncbi:hypothetical protein [Nocardia sp. NPDC057668]|uniref:hypothetical protein n=1 Tax=Nocardia sp. NPDC057668 TaxID=3346202 RepID=UPI00366F844E
MIAEQLLDMRGVPLFDIAARSTALEKRYCRPIAQFSLPPESKHPGMGFATPATKALARSRPPWLDAGVPPDHAECISGAAYYDAGGGSRPHTEITNSSGVVHD